MKEASAPHEIAAMIKEQAIISFDPWPEDLE
jgi:hypothetical protein